MQTTAIYGSPRKNGNTDHMMDAFLEGAAHAGAEIHRIYVRDLHIAGCLGCGHCDQKGFCMQQDDMTPIYPLLEDSPRIVVASPIYFYGITGQLKLLVDRSQALYMKNQASSSIEPNAGTWKDRRGFLLSAGATRGQKLFDCAILCMRYFFDGLGMVYGGELCFRQLEEKAAVLAHPSALEECREMGRRFAARPDQ